MLHVYCDSGGYRRELRELEARGEIKLFQYRYDKDGNSKIGNRPPSSNPSWSQGDSTWGDSEGSWDDYLGSEKWPEILLLLGANCAKDVQHLDSAYLANCGAFLTSDKDDLVSNADAISQLLGISVFHYLENWDGFLAMVRRGG